MTITLVGVTDNWSSFDSDTEEYTIDLPSGIAPGDLYVVAAAVSKNSLSPYYPSSVGYSHVGSSASLLPAWVWDGTYNYRDPWGTFVAYGLDDVDRFFMCDVYEHRGSATQIRARFSPDSLVADARFTIVAVRGANQRPAIPFGYTGYPAPSHTDGGWQESPASEPWLHLVASPHELNPPGGLSPSGIVNAGGFGRNITAVFTDPATSDPNVTWTAENYGVPVEFPLIGTSLQFFYGPIVTEPQPAPSGGAFEYQYRWAQIGSDLRDPRAVQLLEERDRAFEEEFSHLSDCFAFFTYRYRWPQIAPLLYRDFDKAIELLEERDRELEFALVHGETTCPLEYPYRWPQTGKLLAEGNARALLLLEENDRVAEAAIGYCQCGSDE